VVATSEPRVSVAIPVYNTGRFLAEAIESVLDQTFRDIEVIVVDDGSTDASRAILERYAESDNRVRLISNDRNLGLRVALNQAWQAARAPLVARVDSDDVALPDRLRRQVEFMNEHRDVAALGGVAVTIDVDGRPRSTIRFATGRAIDASLMRRRNCLVHGTMVIRRAVLESLGGYRLDQAEDYDLWLRISERWQLANLTDPLTLYRQHPDQTSLRLLEQYTLGSLAALAAARARRSGLGDPLDGVHEVSLEVLQRLEIDPAAVASALANDYLDGAATLADFGYRAESAELIADAEQMLGSGLSRPFAARIELKRARDHRDAGKPLSAGLYICRAICTAPRLASGRVAGLLQDRIYGRSNARQPRASSIARLMREAGRTWST
jgi:hypothetical protein